MNKKQRKYSIAKIITLKEFLLFLLFVSSAFIIALIFVASVVSYYK